MVDLQEQVEDVVAAHAPLIDYSVDKTTAAVLRDDIYDVLRATVEECCEYLEDLYGGGREWHIEELRKYFAWLDEK